MNEDEKDTPDESPEEELKEDGLDTSEIEEEEPADIIEAEDAEDDEEELAEVENIEPETTEDISEGAEAIERGVESLDQEEKAEEGSDETETLSVEEEAARIQRQLRDFKRNQIEAALYASGKPVSIEILSTKLEIPKSEVEELINELAFDYLERSTALVIAQMGDRYQMQIKHEYSEKVSKFAEGGAIAEKYLRTLTIIALKQPIMKSLLIKLRGSGAYEHVKYLLDEGLIEARKKGRSSELLTTDKYAEMFGLPKDREEMKRMMIAQLNLEDQ